MWVHVDSRGLMSSLEMLHTSFKAGSLIDLASERQQSPEHWDYKGSSLGLTFAPELGSHACSYLIHSHFSSPICIIL